MEGHPEINVYHENNEQNSFEIILLMWISNLSLLSRCNSKTLPDSEEETKHSPNLMSTTEIF